MKEAFIYDGIRTPFGRYGGALARLRPDDMIVGLIKELMNRYPEMHDHVEDVIIGDSNQAGEDSRNVARNALLVAGMPYHTAGITVNRLCGSGLAAATMASNSIRCNEGNLFLVGGVESMTRAPLIISKPESAYPRSVPMADSTIGWRFPNKKLLAEYGEDSMPETAENIARELSISRADCDEYAYRTQMNYEAARKEGFYKGEIVPTEVPAVKAKLPPEIIAEDEHPRPDTSLDKLAVLRPLHENGIVTAGNASGVNDGATLMILGDESIGRQYGLSPQAKIISSAVIGVKPGLMGLGPVPASLKALDRAGLELKDMDLIEINEAFAVQVLGCLKQLKLDFHDARVNPNGGAIAIGHPLGASGARLLLTATRELVRRKGKYALVTLCIGIGQGIAMVIERVE